MTVSLIDFKRCKGLAEQSIFLIATNNISMNSNTLLVFLSIAFQMTPPETFLIF
ncbi:unnamed protein product (macronuclear) [Paramecium tetraurelia]|uniref:Uncharacterized protein n=1 Tax=Paramecium tetraurelia TaxID=5888 RepID=A0E2X3_PARTE|nr:uncharacterized protein GSPATT00022812001 [Paramecium tetraurelia]CAK89640.1 unnamed protein product [Paramecium tetraurelia]|eukprot:XP_001457037.1 hypothetical protein (macronuclear) [Paramecium tetraurelia strain d4-2]